MRYVIQGVPPLFCCSKIAVDAVADAGRGGLDSVAGEVGVAGCRLNLRVAEQFPDHRQALVEGERVRGRGVRQVVWEGPAFTRIVTGQPLPRGTIGER